MTSRRMLLSFAVLTGCICPGQDYVDHGYADAKTYAAQIGLCTTQHHCVELCADVFKLNRDDQVESCKITALDQTGGAQITVAYIDHSVCGAGDELDAETGVVIDDGGDGWTDDGSTDDGSTDDGSSDDGSSDIRVPHARAATAKTAR